MSNSKAPKPTHTRSVKMGDGRWFDRDTAEILTGPARTGKTGFLTVEIAGRKIRFNPKGQCVSTFGNPFYHAELV